MYTARKWRGLDFNRGYLNHRLKLASSKATEWEHLQGKLWPDYHSLCSQLPQMPTIRDKMMLWNSFFRGSVIWEDRVSILEIYFTCHLPGSKRKQRMSIIPEFVPVSLVRWAAWESWLAPFFRCLHLSLCILFQVRFVEYSYSQSHQALHSS